MCVCVCVCVCVCEREREREGGGGVYIFIVDLNSYGKIVNYIKNEKAILTNVGLIN